MDKARRRKLTRRLASLSAVFFTLAFVAWFLAWLLLPEAPQQSGEIALARTSVHAPAEGGRLVELTFILSLACAVLSALAMLFTLLIGWRAERRAPDQDQEANRRT